MGGAALPVATHDPALASRGVRDILAGDLGAHRALPVDRDEETETSATTVPVVERRVYGPREAEQAWNRRRADLASLGDVAEELSEVDRRIDELNWRAAELAAGGLSSTDSA